MTFEKICEKCKIEKADLQYFVDNNILSKDGFDDEQLKKLCLINLFMQSGLSKEAVVTYFQCAKDSEGKCDQARILRRLRGNMLDSVHDKQKQLDKIDYILYELEH